MKQGMICALVGATALLVGCGEAKVEEKVHTVSEFKADKALHEKFMTRCQENPGQLKDDPNCINAISAARQIVLEHRAKDNAKSGPY